MNILMLSKGFLLVGIEYLCIIHVNISLGGLVQKIEDRELVRGKVLGAGGFGEVRKGSWKSRQVEVAIKQVLMKTKFEDEVSPSLFLSLSPSF